MALLKFLPFYYGLNVLPRRQKILFLGGAQVICDIAHLKCFLRIMSARHFTKNAHLFTFLRESRNRAAWMQPCICIPLFIKGAVSPSRGKKMN